MNEKLLNMRVDFYAKVKPIRPINEGFTLCKCYVLALGKNRNKSNISEDAVNDALPSLYNIPVVGHIYVDEDGKYFMGAHDLKLEKDEEGKYRFRVLTVPYGVVPESNNVCFEEVKEPNGQTKTYLTADIILWTGRYPELNETIYKEDLFWGQSMEIEATEVARNKEDKNYIDIKKFAFSGLCLLGKSDDKDHNHEPCFPEAKVEPHEFSLDDGFASKFEDMKKELALCFSKGGNEVEDENGGVGKDTPITEPDAAPAAPKEQAPEPQTFGEEPETNNASTQEPPAKAVFQFAATYNGKYQAIYNALNALCRATEESYLRYYLADFDDKFAYVEKMYADSKSRDGKWTKGRMAYAMNADETAAIDESSFKVMFVKWLTAEEVAALDKQKEEHAALLTYKEEHQTADKKHKFDSVVEEFSDLQDDEDFKTLKGKMMNFSSEGDLKKELFALRGMKLAPKPELKVPVGEAKQKSSKQELHDEFMDTYLKKN